MIKTKRNILRRALHCMSFLSKREVIYPKLIALSSLLSVKSTAGHCPSTKRTEPVDHNILMNKTIQ